MKIEKYWKAVLDQNADAMKTYFKEDAYIRWHNTNEHFTVEEFIRANCEYPGDWDGKIERVEETVNVTVVVAHVWTRDNAMSFHVVSFMKIEGEKIAAIDEYWGDDGEAPQWRQDKKIGTKIHYRLEKEVMQNDTLRKAYNELAEKTFGLNFEAWYQSGYCRNTHIPYTLFDGEKAVSNVSVNRMEVTWQGKVRNYIQLGTVMTDPDYRGKGLSRYLMEEVLKDWKDKADAIFLFANQSVLDFYPRFGFERQAQYEYSIAIEETVGQKRIEKLNVENPEHLKLLEKCYQKGNPFSKLQTVNGFGLLMFYCGSFLKDCIYYISEMDAVVIAEQEEETLYCMDIFCDAGKDLKRILTTVATEEINRIVFRFTPVECQECMVEKVEDEDDVLFVLKGKENIFEGEKLLFPEIAHT